MDIEAVNREYLNDFEKFILNKLENIRECRKSLICDKSNRLWLYILQLKECLHYILLLVYTLCCIFKCIAPTVAILTEIIMLLHVLLRKVYNDENNPILNNLFLLCFGLGHPVVIYIECAFENNKRAIFYCLACFATVCGILGTIIKFIIFFIVLEDPNQILF